MKRLLSACLMHCVLFALKVAFAGFVLCIVALGVVLLFAPSRAVKS